MPFYHFHLTDGRRVRKDDKGTDLLTDRQVDSEAVDWARNLLVEGVLCGECRRHWSIHVVDVHDAHVMTLMFCDVLKRGDLQPVRP